MNARTLVLTLLALGTLATLAPPAQAVTINPVPMILPVVWPVSASTSAVNVTFSLQDCSNTATACTAQSVTPGTTPTFTLALRTATGTPVFGFTRGMTPCSSPSLGFWCWNETIQWDNAVGGPYVTYGGMIMWSTGVQPANVWTGQAFTLAAKEVRLSSSINEADLPESRAHANATWESQTHANATWESQPHANASYCPQPACAVNGDALVTRSYADSTYEGQPHANTTWLRNGWFNNTWRPAASFGTVTASQLNVGTATASDMTISGAMTTQTAFDPYVMPLVFGGMTVFSTAASLWIARKPGILGKLAIATLLVVAVVWAASAQVSADANAFRWVAVVITSGWVLLVLYSLKGQGVTG